MFMFFTLVDFYNALCYMLTVLFLYIPKSNQ